VLFYPEEWDLIVEDDTDRVSQLLLEAKYKYNVVLIPLKIDGIKDPSGELESGLRSLTPWNPPTDIH
jgi:hypothetical protein